MPKKLSMDAIMLGCQKGDPICQKELVMECSEMLFTVALRYMRDHFKAQDVLQDAFIRVFKSIQTFDPNKGNAKAWMRRIVINTALKALNKQQYTEDIDATFGGYDAMDAEVVSQLQAEDLLEVVKSLPTMYRKVFNLSVIDGFNHKEIAEMLGINESTSRSNLTRAKSLMRKHLLKLETEELWVKVR